MAYDQIAADAIRDAGEAERRITSVLADCDRITTITDVRTHWDECWTAHTACWAARIRRTLTEETP